MCVCVCGGGVAPWCAESFGIHFGAYDYLLSNTFLDICLLYIGSITIKSRAQAPQLEKSKSLKVLASPSQKKKGNVKGGHHVEFHIEVTSSFTLRWRPARPHAFIALMGQGPVIMVFHVTMAHASWVTYLDG
jgi:hypothetical protein